VTLFLNGWNRSQYSASMPSHVPPEPSAIVDHVGGVPSQCSPDYHRDGCRGTLTGQGVRVSPDAARKQPSQWWCWLGAAALCCGQGQIRRETLSSVRELRSSTHSLSARRGYARRRSRARGGHGEERCRRPGRALVFGDDEPVLRWRRVATGCLLGLVRVANRTGVRGRCLPGNREWTAVGSLSASSGATG
jgi:hypothetical protein